MAKKNKSYEEQWYDNDWDDRDDDSSDRKRFEIREQRRNKNKKRNDFFDDQSDGASNVMATMFIPIF
jgi:hypothetical protein